MAVLRVSEGGGAWEESGELRVGSFVTGLGVDTLRGSVAGLGRRGVGLGVNPGAVTIAL